MSGKKNCYEKEEKCHLFITWNTVVCVDGRGGQRKDQFAWMRIDVYVVFIIGNDISLDFGQNNDDYDHYDFDDTYDSSNGDYRSSSNKDMRNQIDGSNGGYSNYDDYDNDNYVGDDHDKARNMATNRIKL